MGIRGMPFRRFWVFWVVDVMVVVMQQIMSFAVGVRLLTMRLFIGTVRMRHGRRRHQGDAGGDFYNV